MCVWFERCCCLRYFDASWLFFVESLIHRHEQKGMRLSPHSVTSPALHTHSSRPHHHRSTAQIDIGYIVGSPLLCCIIHTSIYTYSVPPPDNHACTPHSFLPVFVSAGQMYRIFIWSRSVEGLDYFFSNKKLFQQYRYVRNFLSGLDLIS